MTVIGNRWWGERKKQKAHWIGTDFGVYREEDKNVEAERNTTRRKEQTKMEELNFPVRISCIQKQQQK